MIFPGALGDLICIVPALREIARRHSCATLELMARAELARFATGRLGIGRGHSIDRREVAQLFTAGAESIRIETRAFFQSFRQVYSFFAADNEDFRAALDAASAGHASHFPFRPAGDGHVAAAYLRAIRLGAGEKISDGTDAARSDEGIGATGAAGVDCSIDLSRDDLDLAEERLGGLGLEVGNYVLLLPGSGSPAKNWPAENFAALAASIAPRIQSLVVLGPAEAALEAVFARWRSGTADESSDPTADAVANSTAKTASAKTVADQPKVIANLELAEVAALARLARCFVANDSGVAHLAAAAGAPGLTIFGPTDPSRWRPLGRTRVLRREPLGALTVSEVEAAILEIIGS